MELALNQKVPVSSPGRRTKVVKLYELLYPNCRAHRATTRRFKHFRRISNSKPVAIHIATCGFETEVEGPTCTIRRANRNLGKARFMRH